MEREGSKERKPKQKFSQSFPASDLSHLTSNILGRLAFVLSLSANKSLFSSQRPKVQLTMDN